MTLIVGSSVAAFLNFRPWWTPCIVLLVFELIRAVYEKWRIPLCASFWLLLGHQEFRFWRFEPDLGPSVGPLVTFSTGSSILGTC